MAVSAWLTSSWRSRASRRRSSSWARMASVPERRRSSSMRSSSRLKERDSLSISSTGSPSSGSWWLAGSAGSMPSIRLIRRSSGAKRRWSIHRFTHSVRTIASARIRNDQRWSETVRSRPAARLAANSVRATSTTLAATTWPMSESSRRVIEGLSWIGTGPPAKNGVSTPYRQRLPEDETPGEASSRWNCQGLPHNLGLGLPPGRPKGRPGCRSGASCHPAPWRYTF